MTQVELQNAIRRLSDPLGGHTHFFPIIFVFACQCKLRCTFENYFARLSAFFESNTNCQTMTVACVDPTVALPPHAAGHEVQCPPPSTQIKVRRQRITQQIRLMELPDVARNNNLCSVANNHSTFDLFDSDRLETCYQSGKLLSVWTLGL